MNQDIEINNSLSKSHQVKRSCAFNAIFKEKCDDPSDIYATKRNKKNYPKAIVISILVLFADLSFAQNAIQVMSYNIRMGTADDGDNHWNIRKEKVADVLDYYHADFIGLQEAQQFQLDYLSVKNPDYQYIGKGRSEEVYTEYSCIFYNKNKYKVVSENTSWLSETPTISSKSWDASLPRIVTYGLFQNIKTKKKIWIVNTHFDHIGKTARLNSSKIILEKIKEMQKQTNVPVIFMGDLNARAEEESIQLLTKELNETRTHCKTKPYGEKDTWNGFKFSEKPDGQIDYIFIDKSNKLSVEKYRTITDFYDFKYPSDHLPIFCTLNCQK